MLSPSWTILRCFPLPRLLPKYYWWVFSTSRDTLKRERGIHHHGNMRFILCSFEFITKPASVTAGGSVVQLALLAEGILEEIMAGFKSWSKYDTRLLWILFQYLEAACYLLSSLFWGSSLHERTHVWLIYFLSTLLVAFPVGCVKVKIWTLPAKKER